MQVAADGPVSLHGHHGVDVGLAVGNLTATRHLGRQGVAGIGMCGGVLYGGGADAAAILDQWLGLDAATPASGSDAETLGPRSNA